MLTAALMFGDHMILQRDKKVKIWGNSEPGDSILIQIQGTSVGCTAARDGKWSAEIGPLQVSFSEVLRISGSKESLEYKDVQVGDVYLAAGQSNMEFFMRYDADLKEELPVCSNDSIRFFDYPEVSYPGQISEADYTANFGFWRKACPEQLEWFSAVGYYFAKEIQHRYQIPVGILGCNWGGTPACAWMSREAIMEGGGKAWIDEYEEGLKTLDLSDYNEQFRRNPVSWKTNPFEDPFTDMLMQGAGIVDIIRRLTGQDPDPAVIEAALSAAAPVGPKSETRPSGLHESMLTQTAPYTLKGILFYQGESDGDRHPELYGTMFPALIRCFRDLWKDELPFLFVQIAPFGSWMQSSGIPYPAVRRAQQLTSETVPGTGMAVISDIGMELDIHPKKKQPVGRRLALQAVNRIYGESDVLCEAPTLTSGQLGNGELILHFENAGDGLYLAARTPDGVCTDSGRLGGLEIFVNGSKLDPSDLQALASGNSVTLKNPAFRKGAEAVIRLGCGAWYRINLYNSADLPARPAQIHIPAAHQI